MLTFVRNDNGDPRLTQLNQKIVSYNSLMQKRRATVDDKKLAFELLEEIHFMASLLIEMQMKAERTNHKDGYQLASIRQWPGIGREIHNHVPPPREGLPIELNLMNLNKANAPLPSAIQWQAMGRLGSFWRRKEHVADPGVLAHLNKLQEIKSQTDYNDIDYFYALQALKNDLLTKLSFELISPQDSKNFRELIAQVNHELIHILNVEPHLNQRYVTQMKYGNLALARQLNIATSDEVQVLTRALLSPRAINPGPPTKAMLVEKFPGLAHFELLRIGGANNINWRLTNPETGQQYLMRIQIALDNQPFLDKLSHSSLNEFLGQDFINIKPPEDGYYSLVMCEFVTGGDLAAESRRLNAALPDARSRHGLTRANQLIHFCQEALKNQCLHGDIKLTNFLLDNQGKLVVSDKKCLSKITVDGRIDRKDITTTGIFAPPEWHNIKNTYIAAEAFMTYQIGLALYDYLIAPDMANDIDIKEWSEYNPLDFDKPFFKTAEGQKIAGLIAQMTEANPDLRPSLASIQQQLTELAMIMTADVNKGEVRSKESTVDAQTSIELSLSAREKLQQLRDAEAPIEPQYSFKKN